MKDIIDSPVIRKVWAEQSQLHDTRKEIIKKIEGKIGFTVLTYYTSFHYPVYINDEDADIIEGILQKMDLSNNLALIINSPGGLGTAAERIINICKTYSKDSEFYSIVPNRAKSAATMICFGANKIYMGKTSELGPIDPIYYIKKDDGIITRVSLYNLVNSYWQLFNTAVDTKGHIEPFIQQLSRYDAREIREFENAINLSRDIAIKALKNGMMKNYSQKEIVEKINIFLTPEVTKAHERAIYLNEAEKCGLDIEEINVKDALWNLLYELHIRTNNLVTTNAMVCIESKDYSFMKPVPEIIEQVEEVE